MVEPSAGEAADSCCANFAKMRTLRWKEDEDTVADVEEEKRRVETHAARLSSDDKRQTLPFVVGSPTQVHV
jgi:hypothetical protein